MACLYVLAYAVSSQNRHFAFRTTQTHVFAQTERKAEPRLSIHICVMCMHKMLRIIFYLRLYSPVDANIPVWAEIIPIHTNDKITEDRKSCG